MFFQQKYQLRVFHQKYQLPQVVLPLSRSPATVSPFPLVNLSTSLEPTVFLLEQLIHFKSVKLVRWVRLVQTFKKTGVVFLSLGSCSGTLSPCEQEKGTMQTEQLGGIILFCLTIYSSQWKKVFLFCLSSSATSSRRIVLLQSIPINWGKKLLGQHSISIFPVMCYFPLCVPFCS